MDVLKEHFYRHQESLIKAGSKPYFLDFHKLMMIGEFEYPGHYHSDYEAIFVVKNIYYCNLNKQELEVKPGYILVIKPGDYHQDHLNNNQFPYVLHFNFKRDKTLSDSKISLFEENIFPTNQITLQPMEETVFFDNIEKELKNTDAFSKYMQDALLEVFFWRMLRLYPKTVLSKHFKFISEQEQFCTKLFRIFEKKHRANLQVEDIAKAMAMSKRKLTYKCKEYLDLPPAKVFSNYKLQRAAELLIETADPIQEISNKLGYDNQFQFSRAFKQHFNISPKGYRKSYL
ncbi:MAG: helix-turn-helix transcriptional regulator [bacterium]|nr:helix-turn-helix transcriptional regulator [bacterium]